VLQVERLLLQHCGRFPSISAKASVAAPSRNIAATQRKTLRILPRKLHPINAHSAKRWGEPTTNSSEGQIMPLTKLDNISALIVIDLQKGITSMPTVHPAKDVIARSAQLARAFRQRNLPVVLVNVSGPAPGRTEAGPPKFSRPPDWSDLVPELDAQPSDHRVTKQNWGAFLRTDLHEYLQQRQVTQVVIAGIATSMGVESTARSAFDLGYNVALATDAITDRDLDAHRHSVEKIFPRLGETAQTEDVLKLLQARG
jgi:nicotinamidase-related amidase